MNSGKQPESLTGVGCDVTNCVYNGMDNTCHASNIMVQEEIEHPDSETETFCGTYESK